MRILIITSGYLPIPPVRGGAVENLIDLFLKYNELKFHHEITLYSTHSGDAVKLSGKYKFCDIKYIKSEKWVDKFSKILRYILNRQPFFYFGNAYITKVMKELNDVNEFDVVLIENNPEFGLKLHNIARGKLILHLHNDWLNSKTKLAKKTLNCYEQVFTVSDFINKSVSTIENKKIIKTLYNGIDISKYSRRSNLERKQLKDRFGIEEDEIIILYSGRLVPEKGVKELIQAFSKLSKKLKVKLLVVGSPVYGETKLNQFYKELIEMAKCSENEIIFTGYINFKEMPSIYDIADIGAVPSLCEEAFNLTVIENMAASTAIIITNAGAMPELVDSKGAILVNRDQNIVGNLTLALEKLIVNNTLREEMGRHNKTKSYKYDATVYAEMFNGFIQHFGQGD